jgi:hypothetical protein
MFLVLWNPDPDSLEPTGDFNGLYWGIVGSSEVLRIRIRMFLDLLDPDPDPLVRGMVPDPSVIK